MMMVCNLSITRSGRVHDAIVALLHQDFIILYFTVEWEFQSENKNVYHTYMYHGTIESIHR